MQRNYLMIGVLLVIAAGNAWKALVDGELPRFHLTVSGIALALAVVVALSRYEFPVRETKDQPPGRRHPGMAMLIAGSLASVLWVAFGPWTPSAEFDVTGFLFAVQNLGPLILLGFFVLWPSLAWRSHGRGSEKKCAASERLFEASRCRARLSRRQRSGGTRLQVSARAGDGQEEFLKRLRPLRG